MPFPIRSPFPTVKIEIAFDSGYSTLEGDRTWTDVTDDCDLLAGTQIPSYGRSDELSQPTPNTFAVTLNNDGGDYTPGNASSPLFPNVKKGKPIRETVSYGGVDFIRYTGYIDSLTLVWPDGGEGMSQVRVTAASRRSRMGGTAPLDSAIRSAYLASNANAVWPLSDNIQNTSGQFVFLDITNTIVDQTVTQDLAGFALDTTYWARRDDGLIYPHLTDEGGTIFFPSTSSSYATGRYVGGGGVMKINTVPATGFGFEIVARFTPRPNGTDPVDMVIFRVGSAGLRQQAYCFIYNDPASDDGGHVGLTIQLFNDDYTLIEQPTWFTLVADEGALYDMVTDGNFHHFYLLAEDIGGTTEAVLYVDGEQVAVTTTTLATIDRVLDSVMLGNITRHGDLWTTWAAAHDRIFTLAELTAHAGAATAASETPEERVVRVAGRLGLPADEVDVEDTIAGPLGPQAEAGLSGAAVIDAVADSTGGVQYDTREGHLAMQARNHRYNQAFAFSLTTEDDQIEADLSVLDDHRYTKNIIDFSREGSNTPASRITDEASREAYGDFNPGAYTVISESDTEVEDFAQNLLARYADPAPRVSTVTVDIGDLNDDALRALVLAADVGTRFELSGLPPEQAPSGSMALFIEGYSESITPAGGHTITFNTTPADIGQNVFILDDPSHDVLDVNVLAY